MCACVHACEHAYSVMYVCVFESVCVCVCVCGVEHFHYSFSILILAG